MTAYTEEELVALQRRVSLALGQTYIEATHGSVPPLDPTSLGACAVLLDMMIADGKQRVETSLGRTEATVYLMPLRFQDKAFVGVAPTLPIAICEAFVAAWKEQSAP